MRFLLCVTLCLTVMCANLRAEDTVKQTITINGQDNSAKFVSRITFDGDNITLNYEDGTTESHDMSIIKISFEYTTSGIDHLTDDRNNTNTDAAMEQGPVYNLNGQKVADNKAHLSKGIYIINNKKYIIK